MISMKLPDVNNTPETFDEELEYVDEWVQRNNHAWTPQIEINMLKKALKEEHLYTETEIRKMKTRLRHMKIVKAQLKRGPGFGN